MGNSWHQEWWGAEQKPGKHHSFPSAIGLPSVSSTALGWAAVRLWQVLGEEKSVVEIILPQPDSKVEPANFLQASLQDWGSSSRDVSWDLLKTSGRMFFGSLIQVFLSQTDTPVMRARAQQTKSTPKLVTTQQIKATCRYVSSVGAKPSFSTHKCDLHWGLWAEPY